MRKMSCSGRSARGFTLLELAVVVLVITMLVGSLLVPLATQVEQRKVSETQHRLAQIQDALVGFAIANGRFPCPASTTSAGVEDPPGGGNCNHFFDGYVPGKTLGLPNIDEQGYVVDAWGLQANRIRYAITNATVGATVRPFTTLGGMRSAGITALGDSATNHFLYVCAGAAGTTPTQCSAIVPPTPDPNALSRGDAVFVLLSAGKNAGTGGGTSPDEAVNQSATPVFVSKPNSDVTGSEFDDLLVWESRYTVLSRLSSAGQLP